MNPGLILIPIILPILGGFLLLVLPSQDLHRRNFCMETLVIIVSALTWLVILACSKEPVTVYRFADVYTITFRVDGLSQLFAGMVASMWPLVMLYAFSYMRYDPGQKIFFAFYVMTFGVTLGVAFSANLLTMYVFFEMLTLVTIPLVGHYQNHESFFAARKYAAYTIGGASLALIAVVYVSVTSGGDVFTYGGVLNGGESVNLLLLIYMFGFFGFGTKAAIFPLHEWLPAAGVAPTPVTGLLHAVAVVNSGVFAVMRLTYYAYGPDLLVGTLMQNIALLFASFTIVYAAVAAVRERHFKRRLAYSTVSNLSYMLFGVMLLTPAGFTAGMAHMLFHGIIKIGLFLCAGAFMHCTDNAYIYEINGIGRKMPVTFVLYTLSALSLTGIPLFCGFVSKWRLLLAGARQGSAAAYAGTVALVVSAFLCAIYTLTISVRAFFPVKGTDLYEGNKTVHEADLFMLMPLFAFQIANILFGIHAGPIITFLGRIASGKI